MPKQAQRQAPMTPAQTDERVADSFEKLANDMAKNLDRMSQESCLETCYSMAIDSLDMHTDRSAAIAAMLPSVSNTGPYPDRLYIPHTALEQWHRKWPALPAFDPVEAQGESYEVYVIQSSKTSRSIL